MTPTEILGLLLVFCVGFVAGHVRCAWHYEARRDADALNRLTYIMLQNDGGLQEPHIIGNPPHAVMDN